MVWSANSSVDLRSRSHRSASCASSFASSSPTLSWKPIQDLGLRVSGLGVRVKGLGSDLERGKNTCTLTSTVFALQGVHTHTHDLKPIQDLGLRVSGLGVRVKGFGSDLELALQGVHTHTHDLTNTLAHTHLPYNPSIPVAPFVKSVTPLAPPSLSPTFQMPTPIDPGECNVRYMHESNPNP